MSKRSLPVLAFVAGLAAFAAPVHADVVTNGSFEAGSFAGWVETGDSSFNGVQCPGSDASVYGGNCSAYFGPSIAGGGIQQAVGVGSAGLAWNLSFAFLPDGGSPTRLTVLFGGQTLLSLSNPPAGGYTLYQFSGVTTAPTMTLAFNFVDPVGLLFLDAVSVSVVPEPSTVGLLGAGLAGLAGLAMARRRQQA